MTNAIVFTGDELRSYGDKHDEWVFAGSHHVRFIDADVPIHVISRTHRGQFLLRPCAKLKSIIAGVIGRAQARYKAVHLYAAAFMSNHAHFMLQGPPDEVPAFIGYIKREISKRWGREIGWQDTMWREYVMAALPTPESQVECLKYILSQGTKEGLVERPTDWPGFHCAEALLGDGEIAGFWVDATAYSRALDREKRKRAPRPIDRQEFQQPCSARFESIPAWSGLGMSARRAEVARLIREIEEEGSIVRDGQRALGPRKVQRIPLTHRTQLPSPPWRVRRRRLVCWASRHAPETRAYEQRYKAFQNAFADAKHAAKDHIGATAFPEGSFAPGGLVRPQQRRGSVTLKQTKALGKIPATRHC